MAGSNDRVKAALAEAGYAGEVREMPQSTRSAAEAAQSVGCSEAQIAKSLVFHCRRSNRVLLAIVAGPNRADAAKLAALAGEPVAMANADFVRERTGYAIGGVPPLAHKEAPLVFMDRDLLAHGEIWAAAGTPRSLFAIAPQDLARIANATVADLKT